MSFSLAVQEVLVSSLKAASPVNNGFEFLAALETFNALALPEMQARVDSHHRVHVIIFHKGLWSVPVLIAHHADYVWVLSDKPGKFSCAKNWFSLAMLKGSLGHYSLSEIEDLCK